jgi:hypothetical protein
MLILCRSDPASARYGQHLNASEVVDMFKPSHARAKTVKQWLLLEGIGKDKVSLSRNRQWIRFDVSAEQAEATLRTEFHVFEHDQTGVRNIACEGYHVPGDIQEHIDYVLPGIRLVVDGFHHSNSRQARSKRDVEEAEINDEGTGNENDIAAVKHDAKDQWMVTGYEVDGDCSTEITMDCIRTQYQIPNGTTAMPGNELGVFQSLGYHYFQDDLDSYFDNLAPWVPLGTAPILHSIDGGTGAATDVSSAALEANLDFQLIMPIIYPQKTVLYQTDDAYYEKDLANAAGTYKGLFNTFLDAIDGSYCDFDAYGLDGNCQTSDCLDPAYPNAHDPTGYQGQLMCGNYTPTNVISISYSSVERTLPMYYLQRQCAEMMKLALQGITVVESSGDHGVGGGARSPTAGCLGSSQNVFSPRTMSNCPYVLSVGATTLVNASELIGDLDSMYPGLIPTFTAPDGAVYPPRTSSAPPPSETSDAPIEEPDPEPSSAPADHSTIISSSTTTPTTNHQGWITLPAVTRSQKVTAPAATSLTPEQILQSMYPGMIPSGVSVPASLLSMLTAAQSSNAFHIGGRQEQTLTPVIGGSTALIGFTQDVPTSTTRTDAFGFGSPSAGFSAATVETTSTLEADTASTRSTLGPTTAETTSTLQLANSPSGASATLITGTEATSTLIGGRQEQTLTPVVDGSTALLGFTQGALPLALTTSSDSYGFGSPSAGFSAATAETTSTLEPAAASDVASATFISGTETTTTLEPASSSGVASGTFITGAEVTTNAERRQEQTLTPTIAGSTAAIGFTQDAVALTSTDVFGVGSATGGFSAATAVTTSTLEPGTTSDGASVTFVTGSEAAASTLEPGSSDGGISETFVTGTQATTSTLEATSKSTGAWVTFVSGDVAPTASELLTYAGESPTPRTSYVFLNTSTTSAAQYSTSTPSNHPIQGINPDSPTGFTEVATTYFASGGGFSNVFPRPSYQSAHVARYLTQTNLWAFGYNGSGTNYADIADLPPGQYFNLQGRAYPDVAALGDKIRIFNGAAPVKISGTSAAVPIWAAILTLINEERLKAGKSRVGFVHPVLVSICLSLGLFVSGSG